MVPTCSCDCCLWASLIRLFSERHHSIVGALVLDFLVRRLAIKNLLVSCDDHTPRVIPIKGAPRVYCLSRSSFCLARTLFHVRIIPSASLTALSAIPFDWLSPFGEFSRIASPCLAISTASCKTTITGSRSLLKIVRPHQQPLIQSTTV